MWREEGTDQNKHLVVVTYFTVFRLPEFLLRPASSSAFVNDLKNLNTAPLSCIDGFLRSPMI
jgi:hypothetical protein